MGNASDKDAAATRRLISNFKARRTVLLQQGPTLACFAFCAKVAFALTKQAPRGELPRASIGHLLTRRIAHCAQARSVAVVLASIGKKHSTRNSCNVMSCGVPSVAIVVNNRRVVSPLRKW